MSSGSGSGGSGSVWHNISKVHSSQYCNVQPVMLEV